MSRWKKEAGKTDVRGSDDVGAFVCGFVFYLSMEHFRKRSDGETKVLFLHVPFLRGKEEFEIGKAVTVGLIKAVAEGAENRGRD